MGARIPKLLSDGSLSVVTGTSSGIGAATARALAARGSHVLLLTRSGIGSIPSPMRFAGSRSTAVRAQPPAADRGLNVNYDDRFVLARDT
jgi:NAD(P)-dependent dehydrogenase (short-subunit alcohol dehydrogenase family)